MMFCDALEPRKLFASVTLITHGYAPSERAPGWINTMAKAVSKREGGADIYRLTIRGRDEDAGVSSFKLTQSAGNEKSGDVIIVLDWARSSDVFGERTGADQIAALVRPYFLETRSETGLGRPLGELPIHLIGHSRGASVVTELAKDLGQRGMWVDHVTTLDAVPVDDPNPEAWENITFFDNYYQRKSLNGITNGREIDGARNLDLSPVFSFALLGGNHEDVWAYYGGTIDLGASSFNGNDIESDWYDDDEDVGPRGKVGYAWSKAVGRDRPNRGNRFRDDGETADRENLSLRVSGAEQWDNASFVDAFGPTAVDQGTGVTLPLRVVDANGDATFSLLLDNDDNPYNGGLMETGVTANFSGSETTWSPSIDTTGVSPGAYYVVARVGNSAHQRLEYSTGLVTVLPPGTGANGTVITFDAVRKVTYEDGAGNRITPKLTGAGSGLIVLPGPGLAPSLISLSGTSANSSFTLSGPANAVGTIQVNGSLKNFTATGTTVVSGFTLNGSANSVKIGTLMGTSSVTGGVRTFSVNSVNNGSVYVGTSTTATPSSVSRSDFVNQGASVGLFSAKGVSGAFLVGPTLSSVKIGSVSTSATSTVAGGLIGSIVAPGVKAKPGVTTSVPGLEVEVL